MMNASMINQIFNENCLETMKRIEDSSIDLILTDPPYNTTQNEWDKEFDLSEWWKEINRIKKERRYKMIIVKIVFWLYVTESLILMSYFIGDHPRERESVNLRSDTVLFVITTLTAIFLGIYIW